MIIEGLTSEQNWNALYPNLAIHRIASLVLQSVRRLHGQGQELLELGLKEYHPKRYDQGLEER